MSKKSSTSSPIDRMNKGVSKHNTLGMEEDVYKKYKKELVEEYANGGVSIASLVEREQKRDIKLYPDRLRRWIVKAGVEVRPQKVTARKMKGGGRTTAIYLRNDQIETLDKFDSSSKIVRVAVDILLGAPTKNIVLFLSQNKSVIFIDGKHGVETYITSDLTDMEHKVIQTLTNKVDHFGLAYVENFAVENELKFYGGE